MKEYLQITKQELPPYQNASLFQTLHFSAKEHGYKSFIWYGLTRYKDHFFQSLAQNFPWNRARIRMQRLRGVKIGKNIHWGQHVSIDNTFPYFLTVEDGVSLAGNNYILTHNKPLKFHTPVSESYVAPVVIRKNAWIAVNVTILPGVTIGEGSIIAAGSIVNKDIPPLVLAAGIPAKVKKDLALQLKSNYSEKEYSELMKKRKEEFGF